MQEFDQQTLSKIINSQKNEITEYHVYKKIAKRTKDKKNREVLLKIAEEEKSHCDYFKSKSGRDVKPSRWTIFKFNWIIRFLGITFGLRLMERGEGNAQQTYAELSEKLPDINPIISDENNHEDELLQLLREEKLDYVDSIVLGLNDALVELTGALAGLSLALQNTRLIAVVGLVTGIAAALSMGSSEYLSKKSEEEDNNPLKSSIYTGLAYLITVIILILPFLFFTSYIMAVGLTLVAAILIIFLFNYYIAVAKDLSFKSRFAEMAIISLSVSAVSFGIGYLIREVFGVDV
ncbi:MAG: VIT1/CCC1 transporter family protein [Bacteroidales bacterium]|nr:VIT1/CCC1 transporter family protein [Bacteroidales bacterium]MCF8343411.1 VIT1/CCC1 transporter family protein [Bacteroidales bacterium]MCF8349851.1 VIT1/CCC1 transporter family protein [Bacteroidales bacterium]MCF8375553.1 VIT1/CCC1 transporter family protein [Bacteroidales bacterium]MCF8399952.1 VIT1/CCC1 transporter family protein [Bacteroidales bacterium]